MSLGAYVSGVSYVIATNGDACSVSIVTLLGSDLANNLGVGDFSAALNWDLVMQDREEGVGVFDVLVIVGTGANALA